MNIPDIHELQRRLDAIPRETVKVICCTCKKEHIAEVVKGDRFVRCPACSAKRMAEMNNEGDVPCPDGVVSSGNEAQASG